MKYIWQNALWPEFKWDSGVLLPLLGRARGAQGNLLGRVKREESFKPYVGCGARGL